MDNFLQSVGAGMATGAVGFMIGGPAGALGGLGIGMISSSQGMRGKSGAMSGALIGGLTGLAISGGNPIGALGGAAIGGLGGKFISDLFKPKHRPSVNAPYYPPMPPMMPNYGMDMGMPGMSMGMGMPGMSMGMQMPGMGMGMPMMGMMMGPGGMGMFMSSGGPGMMMGGMMQGSGNMGGFGVMMGMGAYGPSPMPMRAPMGGQLQQAGDGKPIDYTTSGGYKVNINGHTVTITDPMGKNTVKHWGDPHEDINGKTIKDWEGKTRTLVLGDGTKLTMNADGPQGVIRNMSIYDGAQGIHINNDKTQIDKVTFNPYQTMMDEAYQPDGESSLVGYNRKGEFVYKNVQTQDQYLGVWPNHRLLAKSWDTWWGGQKTVDYYNDPRLPWT